MLTFPVGSTIEIPRVRYYRTANPFRLRRVPIGFSMAKLLLNLTLIPEMAWRLANGSYSCIHAVEEAAFPAILLGHRFRVPVIYDMQSSLPEQLAKHLPFRTMVAQSALRGLERWLLRHADSVVSSAGLARGVRAAAPHARLREWRYASLPPSAEPAEVEALRRSLGIAPGRPVVLYSGTFETYQGLPALLAAMPHVRQEVTGVIFVLVGADAKARAAVEREHAELVRSGVLLVVDRQPREKVPGFLALADVVVSPRAYGDNLPLKVFDYLAAGKPIVATDVPAHRAVLNEERAVLTRGWSPEIASAIVRLLRDRELAARLGNAGRAYAEERFGWFEFVRSVSELYTEVNRAA